MFQTLNFILGICIVKRGVEKKILNPIKSIVRVLNVYICSSNQISTLTCVGIRLLPPSKLICNCGTTINDNPRHVTSLQDRLPIF